jgi:hypothetical protein
MVMQSGPLRGVRISPCKNLPPRTEYQSSDEDEEDLRHDALCSRLRQQEDSHEVRAAKEVLQNVSSSESQLKKARITITDAISKAIDSVDDSVCGAEAAAAEEVTAVARIRLRMSMRRCLRRRQQQEAAAAEEVTAVARIRLRMYIRRWLRRRQEHAAPAGDVVSYETHNPSEGASRALLCTRVHTALASRKSSSGVVGDDGVDVMVNEMRCILHHKLADGDHLMASKINIFSNANIVNNESLATGDIFVKEDGAHCYCVLGFTTMKADSAHAHFYEHEHGANGLIKMDSLYNFICLIRQVNVQQSSLEDEANFPGKHFRKSSKNYKFGLSSTQSARIISQRVIISAATAPSPSVAETKRSSLSRQAKLKKPAAEEVEVVVVKPPRGRPRKTPNDLSSTTTEAPSPKKSKTEKESKPIVHDVASAVKPPPYYPKVVAPQPAFFSSADEFLKYSESLQNLQSNEREQRHRHLLEAQSLGQEHVIRVLTAVRGKDSFPIDQSIKNPNTNTIIVSVPMCMKIFRACLESFGEKKPVLGTPTELLDRMLVAFNTTYQDVAAKCGSNDLQEVANAIVVDYGLQTILEESVCS